MYHYLHALDDTRLVVSNDGWELTETDICSIYNYSHGQKEKIGKYQEYVETLSTREKLLSRSPSSFDIYAKGFCYTQLCDVEQKIREINDGYHRWRVSVENAL